MSRSLSDDGIYDGNVVVVQFGSIDYVALKL